MTAKNLSDDDIRMAVQQHATITDILQSLGRKPSGKNYQCIRDAVRRLSLDTSHWYPRGRKPRPNPNLIPLVRVMVENSTYPRRSLKRRLIAEGILKNECGSCGIPPTWNGKPLTFHLEHRNGIPNDHRLENICLLCPNCHSQTPTYCGRNIHPDNRAKQKHCGCGRAITRNSQSCRWCSTRKTKITWPTVTELQQRIAASNLSAVSFDLGVSVAAVKKHLNRHMNRI